MSIRCSLLVNLLFVTRLYAFDICFPDEVPTGAPTWTPTTSKPTSVPSSSSPTAANLTCSWIEAWDGGADSSNQVTHVFNSVNFGLFNPLFLSVKVVPTDYDSPLEFISEISVNGVAISRNCNPGVECGSGLFTCVDTFNIANIVNGNSEITVSVKATSEVNFCRHMKSSLYVSLIIENHRDCSLQPTSDPTSQPTFLIPTTEPSSTPSGSPNSIPTSVPSTPTSVPTPRPVLPTTQPSFLPTTEVPQCYDQQYEAGSKYVGGRVEHTFRTLPKGHMPNHYFLTVEVIANDYYSANEYVTVYVKNKVVQSQCNPGVDSNYNQKYYSCFTLIDYTSEIDENRDMYVKLVPTPYVNANKYKGLYYLYARMTLTNDPGGMYHLCDSFHPTGEPTRFHPTSEPSSVPTVTAEPTTPSSSPSSQPSAPTFTPTSIPSAPTLVPTSIPSAPSFEPTSVPSVSIMPTHTFCEVWEGGVSNPTQGVQHKFPGVEVEKLRAYGKLHLTVDVYTTDFGDALEYISMIAVNREMVSRYCYPGAECLDTYFRCVANMDISGDRFYKNEDDNEVFVTVQATECVNVCPYNGYPLYVKMFLCSVPNSEYPSAAPTSLPTFSPTLGNQTSATLPGRLFLDSITIAEFNSDQEYIVATESAIAQTVGNLSNIVGGMEWIVVNVSVAVRADGADRRVLSDEQGSITVHYNIVISLLESAYPWTNARDGSMVFAVLNNAMQAAVNTTLLEVALNEHLAWIGGGLQHNLEAVGYVMRAEDLVLTPIRITPVTPPGTRGSGGDDELSGGAIAGIVIGVVVFCALVAAAGWYYFVYLSKKHRVVNVDDTKKESDGGTDADMMKSSDVHLSVQLEEGGGEQNL